MYSSVELKKWVIIVDNKNRQAVTSVLDKLKFVTRSFNFRYNPNPEV